MVGGLLAALYVTKSEEESEILDTKPPVSTPTGPEEVLSELFSFSRPQTPVARPALAEVQEELVSRQAEASLQTPLSRLMTCY